MSVQSFLKTFDDRSPAIDAKFYRRDTNEKPTTVSVHHKLRGKPSDKGIDFLQSLTRYPAMAEFVNFCREHDGFELCRTFDSRHGDERPLLEFKSTDSISGFTKRYLPDGDLAWTIDLNKTRTLYRDSNPWLAFAQIDSGPACLTIFLEGENAGAVYYVTPQPEFNILRPIASSFNSLLIRIGKDIAGFLRLVRATITIEGTDGRNFGLQPFEYKGH